MTDSSLPTYLSRGHALSAADVATGLGAELLSLCQTVTADGRLEPEELAGLRQWLDDAETAQLPAAGHLRRVIERVLADGKITPEEYQEVYRALESILPFEARRQALNARLGAQAEDEAAARAAREAERQRLRDQRRRGKPLASATFMVAGVRQQGRAATIEQHARAGEGVVLQREPASPHGVATIAVKLSGGQQLGFVPKDDARRLAPLLDGGCRYTAQISEIIGASRSSIPVVRADLYRPGGLLDRPVVRVALVAALLALVVAAVALLGD
jgi:hypothetical protein